MSKVLTKDILSKKIFTDSAGRKHFYHTEEYTNQFDTIEDEAADILSRAQTQSLYLNGLSKISEVSAKKLAQAKISVLFLNGLSQVSIQAATEFGKAKFDIYLEGSFYEATGRDSQPPIWGPAERKDSKGNPWWPQYIWKKEVEIINLDQFGRVVLLRKPNGDKPDNWRPHIWNTQWMPDSEKK